jgi:hypothetical protein
MTRYLISLIKFYLDLVKNLREYSLIHTLSINKVTIGKPRSGKVDLSYGSSHIIQMPMRYPTDFV